MPAWLGAGILIGLSAGIAFGPTLVSTFRGAPSPPTYPVACDSANPIPGWHYYAVYNTSSGAIGTFGGGSSGTNPIAPPGWSVVWIGNSSANATLIHSMYCFVGVAAADPWPFHVDLATGVVVWP